MTSEMVCAMPLSGAYLCADCGFVGSQAESCVKCASSALMSLARLLNRDPIQNTTGCLCQVGCTMNRLCPIHGDSEAQRG